MLLTTFSFSHLEIGPHFPLSAISHLGRVIAAHIMWVPTHPPRVLNLSLNPSRSSAKGLMDINVSQWIFLTPCERWEECSHFIDDLAKATAEIIYRARTQESGLIVNEVSFHYTTAPSGAKIDSGNYYKQLWKNHLKVVHQ